MYMFKQRNVNIHLIVCNITAKAYSSQERFQGKKSTHEIYLLNYCLYYQIDNTCTRLQYVSKVGKMKV